MGGAKKKLNQELPKLKWGLIQNKNCYALLNQFRKQEDAIEKICLEHSHTDVGKTWTIGETERKRLKAFEMWCYRRMRNIKWMDRITNEEVLGRIGERRTMWKSLRKRRDQMMGHRLKQGGMLRDIVEGEVGKENGKAQTKIFRPNHWGYGMQDI